MDLTHPDSVQLSEDDENFIRQLLDLPSRLKEVDSSSSNQLTDVDDETFLRRLCALPSNDGLLTYLRDRLSKSYDIRNLTDYFSAQVINPDGSYLVDNSSPPMVKKTVLHKFIEYHMNITDDDFSSVTLENILNLVIKHGTDDMDKLWLMPGKRPAENDETSPKKAKEMHSVAGISSSRVAAVTDILFSTMEHKQFPEISEEDFEGVIPPP